MLLKPHQRRLPEWHLFIFAVVANVLFVWFFPYFPTLDGPGHLYLAEAANCLNQGSDTFNAFLEKQYQWAPNGLANQVLSWLLRVMSIADAERSFCSLYILILCFGFRWFIKEWRAMPLILSWLVFPVVFNALFGSGYLNFVLGFAILFPTMALYMRAMRCMNWYLWLMLALLSLVLLLAHALDLLFFYTFVAATLIYHYLRLPQTTGRPFLITVAMILPSLVLMVVYWYYTASHENEAFARFDEVRRSVLHQQSFHWTRNDREYKHTRWLWIIPLLALLLQWFFTSVMRKRRITWMAVAHTLSHASLMVLLLCMLLFFVPEGSKEGGDMSIRICLMMDVFMIVMLYSALRYKPLRSVVVAAVMFTQINHLRLIAKEQNWRSSEVAALMEAAPHVKENGILQVNYFQWKWPCIHFAQYLGTYRHLFMPDMLGGNKPYSYVHWRADYMNDGNLDCYAFREWECSRKQLADKLGREVDYIICLRESEQDTAFLAHESGLTGEGYSLLHANCGYPQWRLYSKNTAFIQHVVH